jgi:benzoate/toluate 1,2-dioxygenase reductase subunit
MPVTAKVLSNLNVGPHVQQLTLQAPEGWTFQAGQFVILPVPPRPEHAKPLKGFYSIASAETALPQLELLVEHRPEGGPVSAWASRLAAGTEVQMDGPLGHFGLAEGGQGRAFIGSRAGLAPLRSLLLSSLAQGGAQEHWLFLGGATADELLLDAAWLDLQAREPRFHYVPVLGDAAALAAAVIGRLRAQDAPRLYAAGFSRDMDPLKAALLEGGFAADTLKVEKFG